MKKRAYTVALAVLVALMVASGASAKSVKQHGPNAKATQHTASKAAFRGAAQHGAFRPSYRAHRLV